MDQDILENEEVENTFVISLVIVFVLYVYYFILKLRAYNIVYFMSVSKIKKDKLI